jgi:cell division protein FtsI (penicillin-binding protein 3)
MLASLLFSCSKQKNIKSDTAIDSTIQNSANQALLSALKDNEADSGFVIIMETNTGKIKSLIGLEKTEVSTYVKSKNIPIGIPIEPGSLIKPFNLMSLLEDHKADTSAVYDAKGGKISLYGSFLKDSQPGSNKMSLRSAFLNSSNTIFAQAIDNAYKNNPQQYIDNLEEFRLSSNPYPGLSGIKSIILSPKSNSWSDITLPWMAIGYGLKITPLQLLTYFNSIANNGVMVKPEFFNNIKTNDGRVLSVNSKPMVLETNLSKNTTLILKSLLRDVVAKGVCKNVDSDKITISGYAATTQINYSKGDGNLKYASSFVGYFPSDKPKYTILVYITNPNTAKGVNGSSVAGNAVKRIAEKICNYER